MKKKTHILVVSQYFYPEEFRINDICIEWVKRGFDVTVVTGIPNYPQGEFYEGYGTNDRRTEIWNGVKINRIPIKPRKTGNINMIRNYLSFVKSGYFWQKKTDVDADYVFIFEVSPMTQALVGVWYAKRKKIPCYLYVQDLWPDNVEIVAGIRNKLVIAPINGMVKYIYRNCTNIFATSPSFADEIKKKCKDASIVSFWPQYAESFYKPIDRDYAISVTDEIPNDYRIKVVFTGNIGKAQGLDILPKAAKILKQKGHDVLFVIVGDGREKKHFISEIENNGVQDKFLLIGRKSAKEIPRILASCDFAFVSFMNNELLKKTIPAKLQSYMACGMPIIASASGEAERIINEAKCGLCAPIGDAHRLAEIILEIISFDDEKIGKMKTGALEYCEKNFSKERLMDIIQKYFTH